MRRHSLQVLGIVSTALVALFLGRATTQSQGSGARVACCASGEAKTLLPDGGWLISGGQDSSGRPVSTLSLREPQTNVTTKLSTSLIRARVWHTATLLPDGSVLILGGIGADGRVVDAPEVFHPDTRRSDLLPSNTITARAFHSVTVLTDGRVLIAGGASSSGELLGGIELFN